MSELTTRAKVVLDGVTEGPWEAVEDDGDGTLCVGANTFLSSPDHYVATDLIYSVDLSGLDRDCLDYTQLKLDADFCAAARQLVPELIEENESLEQENAALKIRLSNMEVLLDEAGKQYDSITNGQP